MKKRISGLNGLIYVVVLLLTLVQCAKRGTPEGGPVDEDPPRFVRATPENYTTNFNAEEVRIYFNEYVKLENPQQQILISPPMDPKPNILPLGSARRDIRIEITDTLKENTTYTINFGKSIVDNNEANPLNYFKYVFSTGGYLDSLSVSGRVRDAILKEPEETVSVMLYERDTAYSDSAVYNKTPRYITYSRDSIFTFELENLKEGTYKMVAIIDNNNNYNFNPGREKIGFIHHPVSIPTDSSFVLTLFQEELPFEIDRPKQFKGNQILFGYEGTTDLDSVEINLLNERPSDFESRIVKDMETDSLYYWYRPSPETDSLFFEVASPNRVDTVIARISEMERDSLRLSFEPTGNIEFLQTLKIRGSTPLMTKNENLISILDRDSSEVSFSAEIRPLENVLVLDFEKEESNTYHIELLPGAITDFFEKTNDTIRSSLKTRSYADYGNLSLNLQNVQSYPVLVQLTNLQGEVQGEKYSTSANNVIFQNLRPGKFLIRIIYDENENEKWDTGNYLEKRQPERVEYFPDTLEVRANWDINQTFSVD